MRILFLDIDTLRPDHLGCYGYHRDTSPNIDRLAREGIRFDQCYVSDAPCLPSRSGLWSGRTAFHTGVINHGGVAAEPFIQGPERDFRDIYDATGWIAQLRNLGYYTATISPFGERHSAWWWYAGYKEMINPGKGGMESAEEVTPLALDWIERNGAKDNWFLHINYWDPHTPYRAPADFGDPFASDPLPGWLNEDVRQAHWQGFGPHGAQEPMGFGFPGETTRVEQRYPRVPLKIDSMDAVRKWIDGYDTGVRYADEHAGKVLAALEQLGVLDDTLVIVSSDHGENLGELNVWGDHQTADAITCRIPLIIRWPGLAGQGRVDHGLHYHFDWGATLLEMLGGKVPDNWDGRSFAASLKAGDAAGRDYLVVSQGAWSCQRGVRFNHAGEAYFCLRSYHDGYKMVEPVMLFNLTQDPHEQHDLSQSRPDLVNKALAMLADWEREMMLSATSDVDPMMTVLREGGAFHTRGCLPEYLQRLRETGRAQHAERLERLHPAEAKGKK